MDDFLRAPDDLEEGGEQQIEQLGEQIEQLDEAPGLQDIDEQDFQPPAPIQQNTVNLSPSKLDNDDNYLQFDASKDVEHLAGLGTSFHSNNEGGVAVGAERSEIRRPGPTAQELDVHAQAFLAELKE